MSIRFNNKLEEEEERDRLAKIFDQGLRKVVGYALPLRRSFDGDRPHWESGRWYLATAAAVFDSRAIRRWVIVCRWIRCPGKRRKRGIKFFEQDPFAPRGPLPSKAELIQKYIRSDKYASRPCQTVFHRTAFLNGEREREFLPGPHRPLCRGTQRPAVCFHAAAESYRRLSRSGCRCRGDGAGFCTCRCKSKGIRRPTIRV